MKVNLLWSYILHYWGGISQNMTDLSDQIYRQYEEFIVLVEPFSGSIKNKIISDEGCGYNYPYSLLLASRENRVIGIDIHEQARGSLIIQASLDLKLGK